MSSGMWLSGKCFLILEVTFAFFCVIKFVVVFVNDEEDDDSWWHALARWSWSLAGSSRRKGLSATGVPESTGIQELLALGGKDLIELWIFNFFFIHDWSSLPIVYDLCHLQLWEGHCQGPTQRTPTKQQSTFNIFSCPGQLNRWPCHWLTDWLTDWHTFWFQSTIELWYTLVDTSKH